MFVKPMLGLVKVPVLIIFLFALLSELVFAASVVEPRVALEGRSVAITLSNISVGSVVQLWKGSTNCSSSDTAQVFASQQASSTSVNLTVCGTCATAGVFEVCILSSESSDASNYAYSLLDTVRFLEVGFTPTVVNFELLGLNSSDGDYTFPSTALFYIGVKNSTSGSFLPEFCMSKEDCENDVGDGQSEKEELNATGLVNELRQSYFVVSDEGDKCPSFSFLQSEQTDGSLSAWSPITVSSVNATSNRWMAVADNFSVTGSASEIQSVSWLTGSYYTYVIPGGNIGSNANSDSSVPFLCSSGSSGNTCSMSGNVYLNGTNASYPNSTQQTLTSGSTAQFSFPQYPDTTFRFSNTTQGASSQAAFPEHRYIKKSTSMSLQWSTSEATESSNQLVCTDEESDLPTFTTSSTGLADVSIVATTPFGPVLLSPGVYLLCRKVSPATTGDVPFSTSSWVPMMTMDVYSPVYYSLVTGTAVVMNVPTPALLQEDLTASNLFDGVYGSTNCSGPALSSSEALWTAVGTTEINMKVMVARTEPVYLCARTPENHSKVALPSSGISVLYPSPVQFEETFESCSSFDVNISGGSDPAAEVAISLGPCCSSLPGSTPIPAIGNVVAIGQTTAPGVRTFSITDGVVVESTQNGEKLYMCYSNPQDSCVTVGYITPSSTSNCSSSGFPSSSSASDAMTRGLLIGVIVIAVLFAASLCLVLWTCLRFRRRRGDKGKDSGRESLLVKVVGGRDKGQRSEEQEEIATAGGETFGNQGGTPQITMHHNNSEGTFGGGAPSLVEEGAVRETERHRDSSGLHEDPGTKGEDSFAVGEDRSAFQSLIPADSANDVETGQNRKSEKKTLMQTKCDHQGKGISEVQKRSPSSSGKPVSGDHNKGRGNNSKAKAKQNASVLLDERDGAPYESEGGLQVSISSSEGSNPSLTGHPRKAAAERVPLEKITHESEWSEASGNADHVENSLTKPLSNQWNERSLKNKVGLTQRTATEFTVAKLRCIESEQNARCSLYEEEDDALRNHLEKAYAEWRNSINLEGQRLREVLQRTAIQTGQCEALAGANERIFDEVVEHVEQTSFSEPAKDDFSPRTDGVIKNSEKTEMEQVKPAPFVPGEPNEKQNEQHEKSFDEGNEEKLFSSSALPSSLSIEFSPKIGQEESSESEDDSVKKRFDMETPPVALALAPNQGSAVPAAAFSDPYKNVESDKADSNFADTPSGERKLSGSTNGHLLPPPSMNSEDEE